MTQPDPGIVRRRSVHFETIESNPEMCVVKLEVPGHGTPFRFAAPPEVMEYLNAATEPSTIVQQVAGLIHWAANTADGQGKAQDAAAIRRVALWLTGDNDSPLVQAGSEPMLCEFMTEHGVLCGGDDARKCRSCGRKWCVNHWFSSEHAATCAAGRRRTPPPPLQVIPVDPNTPIVATLERRGPNGLD